MRSLILLLLLIHFGVYSQQIAPQSINSAGDKMTQSNGSLSFTVGELVVLSFEDSLGNTLNSGFPNGSTISTVNVSEVDTDLLSIQIYPNPATELVTIEITEAQIDAFMIEVVDNSGKIITSGSYSGISSKIGINCHSWKKGSYYLHIKLNEESVIGTYQIIKL